MKVIVTVVMNAYSHIGDGVCQPECNNVDCGMDGEDHEFSPGYNLNQLGNQTCEGVCLAEECVFSFT